MWTQPWQPANCRQFPDCAGLTSRSQRKLTQFSHKFLKNIIHRHVGTLWESFQNYLDFPAVTGCSGITACRSVLCYTTVIRSVPGFECVLELPPETCKRNAPNGQKAKCQLNGVLSMRIVSSRDWITLTHESKQNKHTNGNGDNVACSLSLYLSLC